MFTGIIETTGRLLERSPSGQGAIIKVQPKSPFNDLILGESIAVNGVCLTVREISGNSFLADVSSESLRVTNLGKLDLGSSVNLERAMSPSGRFGGHIVSGHIDEIGKIIAVQKHKDSTQIDIEISQENKKYIIPKGSITIDGISLTVTSIQGKIVSLVIIPHSLLETTLSKASIGEMINIEFDQFGKYIFHMLTQLNTPDIASTTNDKDLLDALIKHNFL